MSNHAERQPAKAGSNQPTTQRQVQPSGQTSRMQQLADHSPQALQLKQQTEAIAATPAPNRTGLPDQLKSGIESLSGMSMDHVKVHYNSAKPAQLQAHAYAQGSDIHVGPGQERHLPHEAWHVVQQAQGRVFPTKQMRTGVPVNDDGGLEHEADVMGANALKLNAPMQLQTREVHSGGQAVAQLEGRSPDPYERGTDSPQVHHIISHAKLTAGWKALDGPDQKDVLQGFMPDLGSITIRQLLHIDPNLTVKINHASVAPENQIVTKNEIYPEMIWIDAPLTTLIDKNVTLNNGALGFNNTELTDWNKSYKKVMDGEAPDVGAQDKYWKPLQESYLEWSAGNIFYGAQDRVEPGGKDLDAFDSDAKYFRDPAHVEKLNSLALRLESAGTDKKKIKDVLLDVASTTKDAGPGPLNVRSEWLKAKTPEQKDFIANLLPAGSRKDFFVAKNKYEVLPQAYVIELIESEAKSESPTPSKKQAHSVLEYLKNGLVVPVVGKLNFSRKEKNDFITVQVEADYIDSEAIRKNEHRNIEAVQEVITRQSNLHRIALIKDKKSKAGIEQ